MLLTLTSALVLASSVTLQGATWREFQEPTPPTAEVGHGPAASTRDVSFRWVDGKIHLRVEWTLTAQEPGWFMGNLLGPGLWVERVTWNGQPASITLRGGYTSIIGEVDKRATIVAHAVLRGDPERPLQLELLPAVSGTVHIDAGAMRPTLSSPSGEVVYGGAAWHTRAAHLQLALSRDSKRHRSRRTLAMGHVGLGLTVSDDVVHGRAKLQWALREGSLTEVSFRVRGVGNDLDVTGAQIAQVRRSGDRVTVQLGGTTDQIVDLDLSWTTPISTGETSQMPLPSIQPEGVLRSTGTLQVARDGELEVVPQLTGWEASAPIALPSWGQGLVSGTPTATYRTASPSSSGSLGLFRFVPLPGPPVVIDVAAITVATTHEGRSLTRAHYTVRNERAAHLRFTAPEHTEVVGLTVQGQPVRPIADGASWLIPLPRSVDTVEGLLSFPVEVILIGQTESWRKREERALDLPIVSAPVAVQRTTVVLPAEYDNRLALGAHGSVADFAKGEGIAYGYGVGDTQEAEADALFQAAISGWMSNEFSQAQQALDSLRDIGADNKNMERLQANLDLVEGKQVGGDVASTRRIKEQAKARAIDDERRQVEMVQLAEEQMAQGSYGAAEDNYEAALALSDKLDKLEQTESNAQEYFTRSNSARLKDAKAKRKKKAQEYKSTAVGSKSKPEQKPEPEPTVEVTEEHDADGPMRYDIAVEEMVQADVKSVQEIVVMSAAGVTGSRSRNTTTLSRADRRAQSARYARGQADGQADQAEPPPLAGPTTSSLAPLIVHAVKVDVVVPRLGEQVRYEHVLLEANAGHPITVLARVERPERETTWQRDVATTALDL